ARAAAAAASRRPVQAAHLRTRRPAPHARAPGSNWPCAREARSCLGPWSLDAREPLDEPRRGAVLDRGPRPLDPFARITRNPSDLERERCTERERVAVRGAVLARERRLEPRRVLRGVAADERVRRAPRKAIVLRVPHGALDAAGPHVEADERAARRRRG